MILKELYLYPDLVEYEKDIVYPFKYQSRSICNYLERHLKKIKFNTDGFKRVCFVGKSKPSPEGFVNSSNVLVVEIPFDEEQYKMLERNQLNTFFTKLLSGGIERCKKHYDIPGDELLEWLQNFNEIGCVNKWVFKTKAIKELGVKCILNCNLTIDAFYLNLDVVKGQEIIFSDEILSTVPNEIVFVPMFKDVSLVGDCIVVSDKYGDPIYSISVNELNLLYEARK